jgi:hypothetical protein
VGLLGTLPLAGVLILAAGSSWQGKPIAQWTKDDVRQILEDSPWTKATTAAIARPDAVGERRATGKTGMDHGVGFDGINGKLRQAGAPGSADGPNGSVRTTGQVLTLHIRWETALPVRMAELKSDGIEPELPSDGYSIAVYGVPGPFFKGDPKTLGEPLKRDAVLRRQGKKDVKPYSVEVFRREEGLVIIYVFPTSAEIGKKDGRVDFSAQIGRIVVDQPFNLEEMEFQGKLEL